MISARNLTKQYGTFTAVNDISFDISHNEIVALLGLNGAGKTTTLRMLTGFLTPTSGSIEIGGFSSTENPMEIKKQIGYMPEHPALYPDMTVEAFLSYLYRLRLGTSAGEKAAMERALELTHLAHRRGDLIGTLSAGYKKRVGLAQSIVHQPRVLIFDEPIADLDPLQIIEIRNMLLRLKKDHTILISSHILSEVAHTADRYLFIHSGRVIATETPESMKKHLEDRNHYQLEIQSSDSEQAIRERYKVHPHVTAVTVAAADGGWFITVDAEREIGTDLSRATLDWGYQLRSLHKPQTSLEALFMKLTSRN